MNETDSAEAEELAQLAAIKRRLDRRTFEIVERGVTVGGWVWKVLTAVIAVTITVTGFVIRDQFKNARQDERLDDFDKARTERIGQIKALELVDLKHDTVMSVMQRDIDDFVHIRPDIREMVFMRDNGISNKEWFSRKHGYRAPGEQDSTGQPIPYAATPSPRSTPDGN